MDTSTYNETCSDLSSFCDFVFTDCPGVPLSNNLEHCIEARLVEAKRKTHQPVARKLVQDLDEANGLRQRINRATISTRWTDEMVRERLYEIARHNIPGPVAWMVDDTGIIKKGDKSPGVHRQYCGKAGKTENCQIVVSTHLAGWNSSQPLEANLYLPEIWAEDMPRRREAKIPDDVVFQTKHQIALAQMDRLLEAGMAAQPVLADSAYGNSWAFRNELRQRKLDYAVAIKSDTSIWRPDEGPDPPAEYSGRGRPPTRQYPGEFEPVSVKEFASELSPKQFETFTLRRGRHEPREVRAIVTRVRTAHRASVGEPPGDEQWLVVVWPPDKDEPTDYFLSNLDRRNNPKRVVELACLRWRVERDYQDMKQETGFEHYEGRGWPGFHHHLTICMAAHAFLASQRKLFPPQTA